MNRKLCEMIFKFVYQRVYEDHETHSGMEGTKGGNEMEI